MGHGIWNDLEAETTMNWLEQVEDSMSRTVPDMFAPATDPMAYPRMFITPSAQSELKPDAFHSTQNNMRLLRHTREVSQYVKARGYDHLGLYNLTVQASSPDGTHMSYENNLVKAMMILNWLSMLSPRSLNSSATSLPVERPHGILQTKPSPSSWSKWLIHNQKLPNQTDTLGSTAKVTSHAIDTLTKNARKEHGDYLQKTTSGVQQAAEAYRKRRNRHPPPGFDKWVHYAESRDAMLVEDFFDQIHSDLEPFWAVSASEMRAFPKLWPFILSIRNGTLRRWGDEPPLPTGWMDLWSQGLQQLPLNELPDVDLAFNSDDEPRLFVPHEAMQSLLHKAKQHKHNITTKPMHRDLPRFEPLPFFRPIPSENIPFEDIAKGAPVWPFVRDTCGPASEARNASMPEDHSVPPAFPENVDYMQDGYIANWTKAKSVCSNAELRNLHGSFINMLSFNSVNPRQDKRAVLTKLVPLLSGCRIHEVNHEILIPAAMHWPSKISESSDFGFEFKESNRHPWSEKFDRALWRGSASGGVNTEDNWTHFQRHRFVAMLNGSLVTEHARRKNEAIPSRVPAGNPPLPHNFPLPNEKRYRLGVLESKNKAAALGAWVSKLANAAFIHLRCFVSHAASSIRFLRRS